MVSVIEVSVLLLLMLPYGTNSLPVIESQDVSARNDIVTVVDGTGTSSLTLDFKRGLATVQVLGDENCYVFEQEALSDLKLARKDLKSSDFTIQINSDGPMANIPNEYVKAQNGDTTAMCARGNSYWMEMKASKPYVKRSLVKRTVISVCLGSMLVVCSEDKNGNLAGAVAGLPNAFDNINLDSLEVVLLDAIIELGEDIGKEIENFGNNVFNVFG